MLWKSCETMNKKPVKPKTISKKLQRALNLRQFDIKSIYNKLKADGHLEDEASSQKIKFIATYLDILKEQDKIQKEEMELNRKNKEKMKLSKIKMMRELFLDIPSIFTY